MKEDPDAQTPDMDLAALYRRHGAALHRYLVGVLGDRRDAEDALQEVFLRLGRRLFRPRRPAAYLWRCARNEARRALRRRGRRRDEATADGLEAFPDRANPGASGALRVAVAAALAGLPLEQREAVVLRVFEGLSAREVGERLGIPENTAASRYRLGLARLRRRLGEAGEGGR